MTTTARQEGMEPHVAHRQFSSFDELAEAIRGWDLDWRQVDRGRLDAEFLQISSPHALISRVDFSRRFLQRGSPPSGMRTFGLIGRGVSGVNWCRRDAADNHLLAFDRAGDYEAVSYPGFRGNTMSFTDEHLSEVAETLGNAEIGELDFRGDAVLTCDGRAIANLRRRLRQLYQAAGTRPNAADSEWIRHELEFEIPASLLETLASGLPYCPQQESSGLRSQAVRRARDFIDAHAGEPPPIQEVCRVSGVSWRTLDYGFREIFGVTPKKYLQAPRLDGVRKELRRAGPATTVSDIANNWGFWHMGQFAADFKRQFGELPSETHRSTRRARALNLET